MADILKVYTADQLYTMYEKAILADGIGLTDFNEGSPQRALLESNSEIIASIASDFKEALYKSIPVALYEGFGFGRTEALKSAGYLRLYRKPAIIINYTGAGTSALVTSNSTNFTASVTGAPSDAFDFDYASYPTLDDLATAIDALTNWEATLVKDGSIASNTLYQYTAEEVIGIVNYLNVDGLDILFATDAEISIPTGYSITINQLSILTTADGTLEAGQSSVTIAAEPALAGIIGNIAAEAIDTLNGKGFINSTIDGIEQVINDSAFSGGAAEETNAARKTRFADTVNSLNAGTKEGILNALRAISGIRSAGMRTSYPFKGTNTIIIDDGSGSGSLSATLLAEITKVLYGDPNDFYNYPGKNAEGIGYIIDTPTIVPVDVSISVYRLSNVNVDLTEIQTAVQTAIEQYINTRILGENVLLSQIIRVAMDSNAAVYNVIVNNPTIDTVISDNEFAKTGTGTGGTVTVAVSVTSTF
jgi:uncharacterized phage protein gp47/JayE